MRLSTFPLLIGILFLSSCMFQNKAYQKIINPKSDKKFRSAFISEIIFQSECQSATLNCTLATPVEKLSMKARKALEIAKKTQIFLEEKLDFLLPKPCPHGIWEPPFLVNFLEDPIDFNVKNILIFNAENQVIARMKKRRPIFGDQGYALITMGENEISYSNGDQVTLRIIGENTKTKQTETINYPLTISGVTN